VSKNWRDRTCEDNRAVNLDLIRMPARSISPPVIPFGYGRSNYQRQLNVNMLQSPRHRNSGRATNGARSQKRTAWLLV